MIKREAVCLAAIAGGMSEPQPYRYEGSSARACASVCPLNVWCLTLTETGE